MKTRWFFPSIFLLGLVLLSLACQLPVQQLEEIGIGRPAATPATIIHQPFSSFVPPREIIRARVNEPLQLETYHMSRARLEMLNAWVNGLPLPQAGLASQTPVFPPELASVVFVSADQSATNAGYVRPRYPTSAWVVPVIWIGRVPGTYDLMLEVTDKANRKSTITQRIEVVPAE